MVRHVAGIILLTLLVFLVGGVGLYIAGTPGESRALRYDQVRLQDIGKLKSAIEAYFQDNFALPTSLNQLLQITGKTAQPYIKKEPKDPKSKTDYLYKVKAVSQYELCATFDTSSEEIQKRKTGIEGLLSDVNYYGQDQSHPKGFYCFTYSIPTYLFERQRQNPRNQLRYEDLYPQSTTSAF